LETGKILQIFFRRCGYEASTLGFCFSLSEKAISMTEFRSSSTETPFPCRKFAFPRRKSDFRVGILLFLDGEAVPLSAFHISLSGKANSLSELRISVREKHFPCPDRTGHGSQLVRQRVSIGFCDGSRSARSASTPEPGGAL